MNDHTRIIVVGASAGGTQALLDLTTNLPRDLNAVVLIVQHVPAHVPSNLAKVLQSKCPLPIYTAKDGMRMEAGTVYTAVSDYHLLIEDDYLVVAKGPQENRFRPSVDALFRSAAYHYRSRVIGVVLSGALNDGTSGMWAIKRFGGVSIIQSRAEARFDSMPTNVLQYVGCDHELSALDMGKVLNQICKNASGMKKNERPDPATEEFLIGEINIAKGENALGNGVLDHGEFSPLTCPECHGALTEYKEGKLRRFRCHTGHAHTAESLMTGIEENVEKSMWEVMRGLEESQLLLNHMMEVMRQAGNEGEADHYKNKAGHLAKSAQMVKEALLSQRNSEKAA